MTGSDELAAETGEEREARLQDCMDRLRERYLRLPLFEQRSAQTSLNAAVSNIHVDKGLRFDMHHNATMLLAIDSGAPFLQAFVHLDH